MDAVGVAGDAAFCRGANGVSEALLRDGEENAPEHLRAFLRPRGRTMPQWQHQLGEMLVMGSKRCGMRWLICSSSLSCVSR